MRLVRRSVLTPVILAIVFAGLYAALSVVRFSHFEIGSWDNAIFEQAVKGYAYLGAPTVDAKAPGFNQLGDHFSPILVLIAPFYRIFPSAQTILIAQALLLGASVGVVCRAGVKHLGRPKGISIAIAYGLSFGIQSAVKADFHEVAFAAPLLALAGAAYLERDWRRVVGWTLVLLLVKEDMGLMVIAVAILLWFAGRRRQAGILAVGGFVAMALVIYVVVPHFSPTGTWQYADAFGHGRGFLTALSDHSGGKVLTLLVTFGVTGLLCLLSPWVLLALPTLAVRFLADKSFYWGTDFHYSLVLMPIVFIALIDVMKREHRFVWLNAYAVQGAALALAFAAAMQLQSPLSALVRSDTYATNPREVSAAKAISMVPDGASVEADIGLMNHLVADHTVYWVGSIGTVIPSYVLFDTAGGIGSPMNPAAYAQQTFGGTWTTILNENGYRLAVRDGSST